MPRKKKAATPADAETETPSAETTPGGDEPVVANGEITREESPRSPAQMQQSDQGGTEPAAESEAGEQKGKHWGDPYKSIFTCGEMGFELGENRRFRQRVFKFTDKPTDEILAALKEHGFTYRGTEKSWTIPANADTRKLTDELARAWAGPNYIAGFER